MFVGRDVNMHNALALRAKHAHFLKALAFVLGSCVCVVFVLGKATLTLVVRCRL